MMGSRMPLLLVAAATIAGAVATHSVAQSVDASAAAPRNGLQPQGNLDAITLRARVTPGHLGLEPPPGGSGSIELPLGLTFRDDTKSVNLPLADKSGWSLGIGLNLNPPGPVELSPSTSLGLLQPKPAARFQLEKRF